MWFKLRWQIELAGLGGASRKKQPSTIAPAISDSPLQYSISHLYKCPRSVTKGCMLPIELASLSTSQVMTISPFDSISVTLSVDGASPTRGPDTRRVQSTLRANQAVSIAHPPKVVRRRFGKSGSGSRVIVFLRKRIEEQRGQGHLKAPHSAVPPSDVTTTASPHPHTAAT